MEWGRFTSKPCFMCSTICHRLTDIQWLLSSWRTEWNFILCGELPLSFSAPFFNSPCVCLLVQLEALSLIAKAGFSLQVRSWLQPSLVSQMVKRLSTIQETQVRFLSWKDCPGEGNGNPLQYACLENPMMEEPGWLKFPGSQKSMTERLHFHFQGLPLES